MAETLQYLDLTTDIKAPPLNRVAASNVITDDQLTARGLEAENFVEGRLIRLGYSRAQLKTVSHVKSLMLDWCRYLVMRDVYGGNSPSVGAGDPYDRWRDHVIDEIARIEDGKTQLVVASTGVIVSPAGGNARFKAGITTGNTARIFTLGGIENQTVDPTNYDESAVGVKPTEDEE